MGKGIIFVKVIVFFKGAIVAIIGQEGTDCPQENGRMIDTMGLATYL
jgi:hypothetical protein